MLETKTYTKAELAAILGTADTQGINRKLKSYDIEFSANGRGEKLTYTIEKINDEFKVFCILDLEYSPQTDFSVLKYFLYYILNDDDFRFQPFAEMKKRLSQTIKEVSRQTLSRWKKQLEKLDYFFSPTGEYKYYLVDGENRREISKEEYSKMWEGVYQKAQIYGWGTVMSEMKRTYGGIAKKREIQELSPFYDGFINLMNEYVIKAIEQDIKSEQSCSSEIQI